jgi:hypothetical protein
MSNSESALVLVNNLTAIKAPIKHSIDYVWYDISDSIINNSSIIDDISESGLNGRIRISDTSGYKVLNVHPTKSAGNFILDNAVNLINELFIDQDGDKYYDSYETHYRSKTETFDYNDISMTSIPIDESSYMELGDSLNETSLDFDLQAMANLSNPSDLSSNYQIYIDTQLDYLPEANVTGISNELNINMHYFGIDAINTQTFNVGVNGTFDLSVNALTDDAYLSFVSDAVANNADFGSYPSPSLTMADIIDSQIPVNAGRTFVTIPVTVPTEDSGFISGVWNWKVVVVDSSGSYISEPMSLKLQILTSFTEPTIEKTNFSFQNDISNVASINVKYYPGDISSSDISAWNATLDISHRLIHVDKDASDNYIPISNTDAQLLGFTLDEINNDMTIRNTDASANFTVAYNGNKYTLQHGQYIYQIIYTTVDSLNVEGLVKYIDYLIDIDGHNHIDPIIIVNNYDGTFDLSGGNKSTIEYYIVSENDGVDWTYLDISDSTASAYVAINDSDISLSFAVTDISFNVTSLDEQYYYQSYKTVDKNAYNKISIDLSNGIMFGNVITDISYVSNPGYISTETNDSADIYFNIDRPYWFKDIPNASLKILIQEVDFNDSVNLAKADLSGYITNSMSTISESGTFETTTDICMNEFYNNDIIFNPFINLEFIANRRDNIELYVTATFTMVKDGNDISLASTSSTYIIVSNSITNPGAHYNNFIVNNAIKLNLTRYLNGSMNSYSNDIVDLSNHNITDICNNTWRNLANVPNAMHYTNLARELFVGDNGHTFDISALEIVTEYSNDQIPYIYFPSSIYSSSNIDITKYNNSDISAFYSNYNDIFIDLNYFTGTIDIIYNTVYKGELSVVPNKLRVIVIPRPDITYIVTDPTSNIQRINEPSWIYHSVINEQVDDSGNTVIWNKIANTLGKDVNSGLLSQDISGLLNDYTSITPNSNTNITDISNDDTYASLFDISLALTSVYYGKTTNGLLKFDGTNIDNPVDVSNNHLYFNSLVTFERHFKFTNNTLNNIDLTANDDFSFYVINDAKNVFVTEIVANDVILSGNLILNDINLAKYISTNIDINLNDTIYDKIMFIVIENISANSIDITYGTDDTSSSIETIVSSKRAVFRRDAPEMWSFISVL